MPYQIFNRHRAKVCNLFMQHVKRPWAWTAPHAKHLSPNWSQNRKWEKLVEAKRAVKKDESKTSMSKIAERVPQIIYPTNNPYGFPHHEPSRPVSIVETNGFSSLTVISDSRTNYKIWMKVNDIQSLLSDWGDIDRSFKKGSSHSHSCEWCYLASLSTQ